MCQPEWDRTQGRLMDCCFENQNPYNVAYVTNMLYWMLKLLFSENIMRIWCKMNWPAASMVAYLFVCVSATLIQVEQCCLSGSCVFPQTSRCAVTVWLYSNVEEHYFIWQLSLVTWLCELEGYILSTLWVRDPVLPAIHDLKGVGPDLWQIGIAANVARHHPGWFQRSSMQVVRLNNVLVILWWYVLWVSWSGWDLWLLMWNVTYGGAGCSALCLR
jgi:hypothetical protein